VRVAALCKRCNPGPASHKRIPPNLNLSTGSQCDIATTATHAVSAAAYNLLRPRRYLGKPREALQQLNLARKDPAWAGRSLAQMIEIYLSPENDVSWTDGNQPAAAPSRGGSRDGSVGGAGAGVGRARPPPQAGAQRRRRRRRRL
jgi:hypothetical protein